MKRIAIILCGFSLISLGHAAVAQTYPVKPIRIVVPFPPGGTSDIIGRLLGQKLTEAWSQQMIMDNRGGVAGSIGAAVAAS